MTAGPHPLRPPIAAPSILSADFARLPEEVAIADPARDWVHCDIMDHHFVPNLTFGPMIVGAVHRLTPAFLDVHLMVEHPEWLVEDFRRAGADQMTVHLEACADPPAVMTVEPGFGGQRFMEDMLDKVRAARASRERLRADYLIEVDGGIAPDTARRSLEAGADVFVAGHSVFGEPHPAEALAALREAIGAADARR